MPATSFRARALAGLATLGLAACASTASPTSQRLIAAAHLPSLTPTSRIFDAERIAHTGAPTAWDAVRLLVPSYRLEPGGAAAHGVLGTSGIRATRSLRLIIDGHPIGDLDVLRVIPAREIVVMHVLTPTEAANYLGQTESGAGALVLLTQASFRRL